jgi:hypothetical protein
MMSVLIFCCFFVQYIHSADRSNLIPLQKGTSSKTRPIRLIYKPKTFFTRFGTIKESKPDVETMSTLSFDGKSEKGKEGTILQANSDFLKRINNRLYYQDSRSKPHFILKYKRDNIESALFDRKNCVLAVLTSDRYTTITEDKVTHSKENNVWLLVYRDIPELKEFQLLHQEKFGSSVAKTKITEIQYNDNTINILLTEGDKQPYTMVSIDKNMIIPQDQIRNKFTTQDPYLLKNEIVDEPIASQSITVDRMESQPSFSIDRSTIKIIETTYAIGEKEREKSKIPDEAVFRRINDRIEIYGNTIQIAQSDSLFCNIKAVAMVDNVDNKETQKYVIFLLNTESQKLDSNNTIVGSQNKDDKQHSDLEVQIYRLVLIETGVYGLQFLGGALCSFLLAHDGQFKIEAFKVLENDYEVTIKSEQEMRVIKGYYHSRVKYLDRDPEQAVSQHEKEIPKELQQSPQPEKPNSSVFSKFRKMLLDNWRIVGGGMLVGFLYIFRLRMTAFFSSLG